MKKKNLVMMLALGALASTSLASLASCQPSASSSSSAASSLSSESSEPEKQIRKYLALASAPKKTSFLIGDYLDLSGMSVKLFTETDGVKDSGVSVSDGSYSLSTPEGTILSTAVDTLKITIAYLDEADVEKTSVDVSVRARNQYAVSFENYDGTALASQNVKEGGHPTYTGTYPTHPADDQGVYLFDGWIVKGDVAQTLVDLTTYSVSDNVTFSAHFVLSASTSDGTLSFALDATKSSYIVVDSEEKDSNGDDITEITIPASYQNLPITGIGDKAFCQHSALAKVVIPDSVTSIGFEAFYGDSSLTSIELPSGLSSLGEGAFVGCAMQSIAIPGTLKEIPDQTFNNCKKLVKATLAEGVTTLGEECFERCLSLLSFTCPDSLTAIGKDAFTGCDLLYSFHLGAGLASLKDSGLQNNCDALASYTVSDASTYFSAANGILYSKDGKTLVSVPMYWAILDNDGNVDTASTASFVINDTVETIGYMAMATDSSHEKSITSITLGKNVKVIGEQAFKYHASATFTFNSALTEIDDYAFQSCKGLTSVVLPDSVTHVGSYAFYSCSNLASFTFGAGMSDFGSHIFDSCSSSLVIAFSAASPLVIENNSAVYDSAKTKALYWISNKTMTSYAMPDTVKEVAASFLEGNTTLTSLTLSSGLTSIGDHAFMGLSKVTSAISVPEGVTTIGAKAFYNMSKAASLSLPSSLTSIGDQAFGNLSLATGTLSIPASVTSLGVEVFYGCKKITSVTCLNDTLSEGLFYNCGSLTNVTLSSKTTQIPDKCFYGDSALTGLSLPSGVTSLGKDAFQGTSKLASITLPASLTSMADEAFKSSGLTSVEVPASVTDFGEHMFYGCTSLTSATLKNALSVLPEDTFYNAKLLTSVSLPDSLTEIGYGAFSSCAKLASITLPKSVTALDKEAFKACTALTSFDASNVTSYETSVFSGCSALTSVIFSDQLDSLVPMLFYGCTKLTSVSLPSSVKLIGGSAFANSGLTSFTLGDGVVLSSVGSQFQNCTKLTQVTLNSTVNTLYPSLFNGCTSLASVKGLENNLIINVRGNAFLGCKALTAVPFSTANVEEIGPGAFKNTGLTSVELPKNAYYVDVESSSFYGCTGLTEVVVPANVSKIEGQAFYGCTKLASLTIENPDFAFTTTYAAAFKLDTALLTVNYAGTKEQAAARFTTGTTGLKKGALTIICSDGDYVMAK